MVRKSRLRLAVAARLEAKPVTVDQDELRARVATLAPHAGFVRLDGHEVRDRGGQRYFWLEWRATDESFGQGTILRTPDWSKYSEAILIAHEELQKQSRWRRPDLSNWWERIPKKQAAVQVMPSRRAGKKAR